MIKGKRGGRPARVEEGAGGAPWPAVWRSPELGVRVLPCTVLEAEHTGRERKARRIHPEGFVARGVANAAVRGGAMASGAEACGKDSWDHVFARQKAREGEGKEARSPRRKSEAETTRFDG